jgi:hypothetical protein
MVLNFQRDGRVRNGVLLAGLANTTSGTTLHSSGSNPGAGDIKPVFSSTPREAGGELFYTLPYFGNASRWYGGFIDVSLEATSGGTVNNPVQLGFQIWTGLGNTTYNVSGTDYPNSLKFASGAIDHNAAGVVSPGFWLGSAAPLYLLDWAAGETTVAKSVQNYRIPLDVYFEGRAFLIGLSAVYNGTDGASFTNIKYKIRSMEYRPGP